MKKKNRLWMYFLFVAVVAIGWCIYVFTGDKTPTEIYTHGWPIAVTMVFGAFVCGASSEGGGAIAFPVMTLLLAIAPSEARVFSLGCQSFGATAATLLIIGQAIPIIPRCLWPVISGGFLGFVISDLWLIDLVSPAITKIFFVSLWLGFGFALLLIQRRSGMNKHKSLPDYIGMRDTARFVLFGMAGGAVSAMFGNGIDILTFTLLTLYYRIDVKVATPTSVVLMTAMTIFGFLWHLGVKQDISSNVETYLLAAIPVCIIMAPLGAFVISKIGSTVISWFLYFIIVAQFVTAYYVIMPTWQQILISVSVMLTSAGIFYGLGLRSKRESV